jgi:hypothetical protein
MKIKHRRKQDRTEQERAEKARNKENIQGEPTTRSTYPINREGRRK